MELILDDFTPENMTQMKSFGMWPKYDEHGVQYEYRYIETSLSAGSGGKIDLDLYYGEDPEKEIRFSDLIGPDNTTLRFTVRRGANGSVVNTLVGTTQVNVKKIWSTTENGTTSSVPPEGAKVTVVLLRNDGKTSIAISDTKNEQTICDNAGNPVRNMTFSGTAWEGMFENLPRYDEKGQEYEYSIQEISVEGYATDIDYKKKTALDHFQQKGNNETPDTVTQLDVQVTNVKGPGRVLHFDVSKVWLDESDLLHREPVTVGVYRKGEKDGLTLVEESKTTLNAGNHWTTRIELTPENDSDTVDYYVVREISIEEGEKSNLVTYNPSVSCNASYDTIKAGTAAIAGEVSTLEHMYHVYLYKTPSESPTIAAYTIYNQRYGDLTVNLEKTWKSGSVTPAAVFELWRTDADGQEKVVKVSAEEKGTVYQDDFTLTAEDGKTVASWSSDDRVSGGKLQKYDTLGRRYTYNLKETEIGGESVTDGVAMVNEQRFVSEVEFDSVTYGEAQHTGDEYDWKATNTRSETENVEVNKVWWDDGTSLNTYARPDVTFTIYRTSAASWGKSTDLDVSNVLALDAAGLAQAIAEKKVTVVSSDRLWNTMYNDWYWGCDLGALEKYDEEGNGYIYFLTETVKGNAGQYVAHYYNGNNKFNPGKYAQPVSSAEVFAPEDFEEKSSDSVLIIRDYTDNAVTGETYSATVVNRREEVRYITGRKIWLDLAPAFKKENLPTIELALYRMISYRGNTVTSGELFQDTNRVTDSNSQPLTVKCGNDSNFVFTFGSLPKYDEYGRLYHYGVKEVTQLDGYAAIEPVANEFIINNTYLLNQTASSVEITVNKEWTAVPDGASAPSVTFELWRKVQRAGEKEGTFDVVSGTEEKVTSAVLASGEESLIFTTADDKVLPYYAPNGQPYLYYVKEVVPKGYSSVVAAEGTDSSTAGAAVQGTGTATAETAGITLTEDTEEGDTVVYKGSVSFVNTYNGNTRIAVSVTKNWEDLEDPYGLRPDRIQVTLYRKTLSKAEGEEVVLAETAQTVELNAGNGWTASWKDLERYAPNSETYTYYVEEAAAAEDTENAKKMARYTAKVTGVTPNDSVEYPEANPAKIGLTNTLETASVWARKSWKKKLNDSSSAKDITDMTWTEFQRLYQLGAIPEEITFTVEYSEDGGDTWSTLQKTDGSNSAADVAKTVKIGTGEGKVSAADAWAMFQNGIEFTELPVYTDVKKNTKRLYRVVETFEGHREVSITQPTGGVYAGKTSGGSCVTVTNTLPVREAQIDKFWEDNTNRDNTRPSGITVTLTRDEKASQQVSFELTLDKRVENNPNQWSTGIFYVPLYKNGTSEYSTYAAAESWSVGTAEAKYTEASVEGYPKHTTGEAATLIGGSNNYNWFAFQNTLNTKTERAAVNLKITKNWSGDSGLESLVRPANAYFKLQVYDTSTETYVDATTENCGVTAPAGAASGVAPGIRALNTTAAPQTVTWEGIWEYVDQDTGKPVSMKYRVVEVMKTGENAFVEIDGTSDYPYTVTNSAEITATGTKTEGYLTGTVTNVLKTTGVSVTKTWKKLVGLTETDMTKEELKTFFAAGAIPANIRFQLYRRTDSTQNWEKVTEGGTDKTFEVVSKENISDTYSPNWSLPLYSKVTDTETGSFRKYQYALGEVAVTYDNTTWISVTQPPFTTAAMEFSSSIDVFTANQAASASANKGVWNTTVSNLLPIGAVAVEKEWTKDEDNRDDKRAAVTLYLRRDGQPYPNAANCFNVTLNGQNEWKGVWTDLPMYQKETSFEKSIYTVVEDPSVDEYDVSYAPTTPISVVNAAAENTTGSEAVITVTNSRKAMERFTVTASKEWTDFEDLHQIQPTDWAVEVKLQYWDVTSTATDKWTDVSKKSLSEGCYPDGTGVYTTSEITQQITAASNQAAWEDLPVNRLVNGVSEKIRYRAVEVTEIKGYQPVYSLTGETPATIADPKNETDGTKSFIGTAGQKVKVLTANTLQTTSLAVEKQWSDDGQTSLRPDRVKLEVLYSTDGNEWNKVQSWSAGGNGGNPAVREDLSIILTSSASWKQTVSNLLNMTKMEWNIAIRQ